MDLQLGRCLDLTDLKSTELLAGVYEDLKADYAAKQVALPTNKGRELKLRNLDCLVINKLVSKLASVGENVQTVRGAFEEGDDAFPGSALKKETHIQVAVRDLSCILGVFRPV